MIDFYRVDAAELTDYCADIFAGFGLHKNDAVNVARSLVDADLRNVTSHGVIRVSNYVNRLNGKGTVPRPIIKVEKETAVSALYDAGNGLGAIVSEQAVDMAINKAESSGIGIVLVKNSNHYGTAAYWSLKLAERGMVGVTCSNVEPLMAATNGKSKAIGNNPISFAFPTRSYGPICYDIACSKMAGGKLFAHKLMGTPLPPDCFLDVDGNPTTDPDEAFKATILLPFGGHKGYGLAVVVEMLTSILSGANFGKEMGSQYGILDKPNHISHFFLAFRIDLFRELEDYYKSADGFVRYLRSLPVADGAGHIYYPGEIENNSKADKLKNGLMLKPDLVDELIGFAREAGIPENRDAVLKSKPINA